MKTATAIAACALPGLLAAAVGRLAGLPGVAEGGIWAAVVGAFSALWLVLPMGSGPVMLAARLGLGFFTRLAGALLVAALLGAGRADLLVTLIACLLAAMAAEMVLMLREAAGAPQETARV